MQIEPPYCKGATPPKSTLPEKQNTLPGYFLPERALNDWSAGRGSSPIQMARFKT